MSRPLFLVLTALFTAGGLQAVETSFGNGGNPWPVPATGTFRLETENYDTGGEGVAYHDTTPDNQGSGYRLTEGVDVEGSGAPVTNVGYTSQNEWLRYTLAIAAAGTYDLKLRVANGGGDATNSTRVQWKGSVIAGPLTVNNTGGWTSYIDATAPGVYLSAGTGILQVDFLAGGNPNLDWIEFTLTNAAPVAVAQAVGGTPTVSVASTLTATATDSDGTVASVAFYIDGVLVGTDSDGSDGWSVSWTPSTSGLHTLTARATDNLPQQGDPSAGVSVVVSAGGTNHAPVITTPVTLTVAQDASGTVQIVANDVDGDGLGYAVTAAPTHGAASVSASGLLSYTPTAGYNGSDTCTMQVSDGFLTDSATVSITVTVPVPTPYSGTVPIITSTLNATLRVQAEDFDLGGEGVAFHDTTPLNNQGSAYRGVGVDIETGGSGYDVGWTQGGEWLFYTVQVAATGTYDLTFRVCRGDGAAPNSLGLQWKGTEVVAPISVTDTGWGSYYDVTVTGVALTAGTDVLKVFFPDAAGGNCPNLDYIDIKTMSVGTNHAPTITTSKPAALSCNEDATGSVTPVATDADSDPLTWSISVAAGHGTASVVAATGVVTYTPAANWNGSDTFTVQASDGAATDTIVVDCTVAAVNDASVVDTLSVPGTATVGVAATLTATASDIDGTVASVAFYANGTLIGTDSSAAGGWSVSWTPATTGAVILSAVATDDLGLAGTPRAAAPLVVAAASVPPSATGVATVTSSAPGSGNCGVGGLGLLLLASLGLVGGRRRDD